MASLPKGVEPDSVDLAKALELIAAKAARGKSKGGKRKKAAPKTKKAAKTKSKSDTQMAD